MRKKSPNTADGSSFVLPGITLLTLLLLWEGGVRLSGVERWILPAPSLVLQTLWQKKGLILYHSLQTVLEAAVGFLTATFLGILVATLIETAEFLRKAVYPLLVISQTVPLIAVAPLLLLWFGYGLLPKVFVIVLACFFPIAISLADGYRVADPAKVRLLKAMGANSLQLFRLVKIPEALPFFFSSLRIAGTYSVMGAVIGEWLGATRGLGILLVRSAKSYLADQVFATILVIVVLSLLVYGLVETLARVFMPWQCRKDK